MATKKIELSKVERKYVMPSLEEVQKIDKSVKKILHIQAKGDMIIKS